jgi:hypothetical protein
MPYILRQASTHPEGMITFDFGQPVVSYLVGLNSFNLWFPKASNDHWIQTVRVNLRFPDTLPGPIDRLQVLVHADMYDASGNHLSLEESEITVACVAYTGGPNAPVMGIRRNLNHQSGYAVDCPNHFQTMGLISGFHVGYPEGMDHQIKSILAYAPQPSVGSAAVEVATGGRFISDPSTASLDVGYGGISLRDQENLRWEFCEGWVPKIYFRAPVKEVIAMLYSFRCAYFEPHNVLSIEATAGQRKEIGADGTVTMSEAFSTLRDASGSREDGRGPLVRMRVFATT